MKLSKSGLLAVVAFGAWMSLVSGTASAAALTAAAKAALQAGLEDEYRAEAFYSAVMDKFGKVTPFSNIMGAEQTHSAEIGAVMKTYGLDPGTNPFLKDPKIVAMVPATVAEACAIGVKGEIDNRDLYEKKLLPTVTDFPDITRALQSLRDASVNNHLPAFERCSQGGAGTGAGRGQGAGR